MKSTSQNSFRIGDDRKRSIFQWLENTLKIKILRDDGLPVRYIPHVLFVAFLCILYIAGSHHAESSQRELNRLKIEVEDLRADYITLKADYMHARLQSEVAKKVKAFGLMESETPPLKINLEELSEH